MYQSDEAMTKAIVGKQVQRIWWSEDRVVLETSDGKAVTLDVGGDCCSHSYFFDLHGVHYLLRGPITAFEAVELQKGDPGWHDPTCSGSWDKPAPCGHSHDCLAVYGYRFTTEHPVFGPVSTVLSFRNDSNGYYGGWMNVHEVSDWTTDDKREVTEDVIG